MIFNLSDSEKSLSMKIERWSKKCWKLYERWGVYTCYRKRDGVCLYVGQSINLGERVSRFFRKGARRGLATRPMLQENVSNNKQFLVMQTILKEPFFLEITTMGVNPAWAFSIRREKLDKLERAIIGIKKPLLNTRLVK